MFSKKLIILFLFVSFVATIANAKFPGNLDEKVQEKVEEQAEAQAENMIMHYVKSEIRQTFRKYHHSNAN